jgi:hypothetical protein
MWSSVGELYPTYFNPAESPVGSVRVVEPQVIRSYDYRPVQPQKAPYELTEDYYSKRLWVC